MDQSYTIGTLSGDDVKRYRGGELVEYEVQPGDTVSTIADKFGISQDSVLWANDMEKSSTLKVGQVLRILPVTGVVHTVKKGETIYSIAKKYGLEGEAAAQGIVNYPFNTFMDDEKFTLAVGQTLIVPDGIMPDKEPVAPQAAIARILTPDAGAVSATGQFVWPAQGTLSQGYKFYHKALDIANHNGGPILAADSGTVIVAGWPDNSGYGNRVMVDHGNGFVTLYGHMSKIRVQVGQTVRRGDVIGDMGSTGRSTGTHLHFEIRRKAGGLENPANYLK
jgi:murein DD-endopeptidase MepM/ murein hydrolase activator NlpD